ncbi:MAG TPA: VPLPA-CTERM sorting domain-containing protein [Gammaproteobacteria bacterium]
MKNFKSTLSLVALTGLFSASSNAALSSTALLDFDAGSRICNESSTLCSMSGSYFAVDTDGNNAFTAHESVEISTGSDGGLRIGQAQPAANSHPGYPDGSETAPLDAPWTFLANTGMHQTTSPVNIISDNGAGTVELDFSGFGASWNGFSFDLGGDSVNYASETGVAILNCDVDCSTGDRFTLDYAVHVPMDDPNNLGGVYWSIHLEGTVAEVPVPAALWLFGSGLVGLVALARRKRA